MLKRLLPGLVTAGVVVLLAAWGLAPVFAGHAVMRAADRGDEAALERLVDFPALRISLKEALTDEAVARLRRDPRLADKGLGGLGVMLAPMLVSGVVDVAITPQGVAAMVSTARAPSQDGEMETRDHPRGDKPNLHKAWGYRDLNTFAITLTDRDRPEQSLALLLERRGLFTWKLAAVDLQTGPDA